MKKYEFTGETKEFNGVILNRIRYLRDFVDIVTGDVGGWIEKESNLSHEGDAQVSGDARVWGDALVWGDAQVSGDARVWGDALVWGNAQVSGDARVSGNAQVWGNAQVSGDARVSGNAQVSGDARVWGDARVSNLAQTLRTNKYHITMTDYHLIIGCKNFTHEEWENFDDETISKMDNGSLEWWRVYKPIIFAILKAEGKYAS